MIIKKKYTTIKRKIDEDNDIISSEVKEFQDDLDSAKIVNNEVLNNSSELNKELQEHKESDNLSSKNDKEEKSKKNDFDLSLDNITFEQREERREGSRRRGYRRTQDRNIVSRAKKDAQSIKEVAKKSRNLNPLVANYLRQQCNLKKEEMIYYKTTKALNYEFGRKYN